jgi:hypothetical protein
MATGSHGFHVIIGTISLTVRFSRPPRNHSTRKHHFGFEAAAWYWHPVDVVWLSLPVSTHWWGNSIQRFTMAGVAGLSATPLMPRLARRSSKPGSLALAHRSTK